MKKLEFYAAILLCVVCMPAMTAPTFTFTYVDDSSGNFASRGWLDSNSDFQKNIRAAATQWGNLIDSNETLAIEVRSDINANRTGGTFSNGYVLNGAENPPHVEPGPLSKIRTGTNPSGSPDIFIVIDPDFVEFYYWFDPTPEQANNDAPSLDDNYKIDFVSIVMHELGHGLGMAGTTDFNAGPGYGKYRVYQTLFDLASYYGGNGEPLNGNGDPNPMFHSGVKANDIVGQDTWLSHVGPNDVFYHSQDFYHIGTCGNPAIFTEALMNGCALVGGGIRQPITALDFALLVDMGYPSAVTGQCGSPDGLDHIYNSSGVSGNTYYEVCRNLSLGGATVVEPTGTLTLRAGKSINLTPGFRVQVGGALVASVDQRLREMP